MKMAQVKDNGSWDYGGSNGTMRSDNKNGVK